MPVVLFAPFSSLVEPSFWHNLTDLKVDVLKLNDDALQVFASYTTARYIKDSKTGQDRAVSSPLRVSGESLQNEYQVPPTAIPVTGTFKNYNTIEDFNATDKRAMLNEEAEKIWDHIITKRDTSLLNRFLLVTFADLKKYKYSFWFCFPAFKAEPSWQIDEADGWKDAFETFSHEQLSSIYEQLAARQALLPYFLVKSTSASEVVIAPVEEYESFFSHDSTSSQTVAFVDPSGTADQPGWPLRNLLAYLRAIHPSTTSRLRILCWRDTQAPSSPSGWKSRFGTINISASADAEGNASPPRPSAVGWERDTEGKLAAREADLSSAMDPKKLAEQAVDLNLKLMRWRILPSLDLEKVSSTKCLLLGAGTLGCYVARTLMAWGVRDITFVDSAHVSFSNPVRQPLFQFEDCLGGGKPKAECAAENLKKIFPGINATGHMLSIPMPGHSISASNSKLIEQAKADVLTLEGLIESHDAVFLLMDSRESRWLPTVIGAAKNKIVINAALGFDSFLVMRHGARASAVPPPTAKSTKNPRLGCYYCNDIVAPKDSLTDRSLDQMCTVTRPGLAPIASATAVELLVSVVQHPDGVFAAAPRPDVKESDEQNGGSILGSVPHQLRGSLAQFRNMPLVGAAYDKCTGCSETVVQAYETEGFDMLLKAFNDTKYLETLTGLDKLFDEGEAVLESVDWDEAEDDF